MKRFFGFQWTSENENNDGILNFGTKKKPSWPKALDRVNAAHTAQQRGGKFIVTRSAPTTMVICPILGKDILHRFEDCHERRNEADSDSDESERVNSDADMELDPDDGCNVENSSSPNVPVVATDVVRLHKPIKPNRLLQHALTNANGDDWRRQRPLVQRALGDSVIVKSVAVPASVQAALESLVGTNGTATSTTIKNDIHQLQVPIEARSFSLQVAILTMMTSVFGEQMVKDSQTRTRLQQAIASLFFPTLLPVRGDTTKAEILDTLVRDLIETLTVKMATTDTDTSDYSCLAINLLKHEHIDDVGGKSCLSRNEVVGNCHSALLAGTQTIATTLVSSLLHLAEYPLDQHGTTRAFFRAVVTEALRILPPVASLPRCPVHGNLDISSIHNTSESIDSAASTTAGIPEGEVLVLDVLSMAHASPQECCTSADETTTDEINTWKFCPTVTGDPKQPKPPSSSYPWGFGDRICPAGNLSVSCISAVLESLVVQQGWTWELAHPQKDSVGPSGKDGWVATVSYQPTLLFPNPLLLEFSRSLNRDD